MQEPIAAKAVAQDALAQAIEGHLRNMQAAGQGTLKVTDRDGIVRLSFGPVMAIAENYDLALLRLASMVLRHMDLHLPLLNTLHERR